MLNIIYELCENFPDYIHNCNRITPFELAQSHDDYETAFILYNNYLKWRKNKTEENKLDAKEFLSDSQNFSLEMKWEVQVPLLSYFCPNDTCTFTKFGEDVRMDYTFQEFKKISSVRSPTSWMFSGKNSEINLTEWEKKTFFNPFEEFDES